MGQPVPISLGYRSNPARKNQAGIARLTNCFAEELGEEGKSTFAIYAFPGLKTFGSALPGASGGVRGMLAVGNTLYVVASRQLYQVNTSGAATLIGGIPTDGPVYMRRNRRASTQIGIVSDGLYYVLDTGVLTAIDDPDLPPPTSLAYLDGYGILPGSNGRFMITAIDDFTLIDGLDQGVCESNPDEIVRAETLEREAVFFGEQSIEWHQNTGDADFPFTRSGAAEIGCLASDSVAKVDTKTTKTLIWVAPDHTVRQMTGYSGTVISSREIEKLIEKLHLDGDEKQLKATSWASGGRFFYALSCNDWTRIYNSGSGNWSDLEGYETGRWRVSEVVQFGNKLIAGDFEKGQLYELRGDTFADADTHLVKTVVTPIIHAFPYRVRFNALHLDIATGVGLNTTVEHNKNPKIIVDWSDDGGVSWSAPREADLGAMGKTQTRVRLNRMGVCGPKGRSYRFRISAAVETCIMNLSVDFDRLGS